MHSLIYDRQFVCISMRNRQTGNSNCQREGSWGLALKPQRSIPAEDHPATKVIYPKVAKSGVFAVSPPLKLQKWWSLQPNLNLS